MKYVYCYSKTAESQQIQKVTNLYTVLFSGSLELGCAIWGTCLIVIFFDRYCDLICDFKFAVKLQLNIVNNVQHSMSIVTLLKKNNNKKTI